MIVFEDEPSLEQKKDEVARKVILAAIRPSDWLPIPKDFDSGSEIGFNVGALQVRARVVWNNNGFTMEMTSPVHNYAARDLGISGRVIYGRVGPFNKWLMENMKAMLEGMYADWVILRTMKDDIARKLSSYEAFATDFHLREVERIAPLRARLPLAEKQSGELKRELHSGLLTQKEYMPQRKLLHEEIVSLKKQIRERDAFEAMFREEMDCCRFAFDRRAMIESVCLRDLTNEDWK